MEITPHSPSSMWYSPTPLEHPSKEAVWEKHFVTDIMKDPQRLRQGGLTDFAVLETSKIYVYPQRLDVDYIYLPDSWPIFSTRVVDVMEKFCPDNIQKHKAPLYDWKTKKVLEDHDFWVVNIVHVVECIDWERCTIYEAYKEEQKIKRSYINIENLALDGTKIPANVHLLRLLEFRTNYFFSQSLYDQFVGMNLKGIAFFQHGVRALKEANPLTFRP